MDCENTRNIKTHISQRSLRLPEEIIEEILSRLPVQPLLKFRCVSKSWRFLIDSKHFCVKHLNHSTNNATFAHHEIILNSIAPEPDRGLKQCYLRSMLDDPFTDHFKSCDSLNIGSDPICVVGCCNGVVCILVGGKHFMLWNPSTKKTKNLPAIDRKIKHGHVTSYGFGFDDLSGDYKVFGIMSVFWVSSGYQAISKVYSLETNSWNLVKNGEISPFSKEGKFASGKLHWHRTLSFLYSEIASFDLGSEVYGVVQGPSYSDCGFVETMGVVGGYLSMLCHYKCGRTDIWIMKQYGVRESWEKVATVPRLDVPLVNKLPTLFYIGPDGEILLTYGSTFVIYYPKDDGYRHCQVNNLVPFRVASIYVESLVSLIPYGVE